MKLAREHIEPGLPNFDETADLQNSEKYFTYFLLEGWKKLLRLGVEKIFSEIF